MDTGTNIWSYSREYVSEPIDVEGFKVEATDGDIGRIDEATYEVWASYVVVDTGPWIFGRRSSSPPARSRRSISTTRRSSCASRRTRSRAHQGVDETTDFRSDEYRSSLGDYYDPYVRL